MPAEYAPAAIAGIFRTVDAAYPEVLNGGIIGDQRHGTGYHRSRNALIRAGKRSDYSLRDLLDQQGDGDAAAALDITCPTAAMKMFTRRLVDATKARDPRLVGKLREFGGTIDGRNVTAMRVSDAALIQFDKTHLWHEHLSIHRKWVNDTNVCQGIAAVLCGVPLAQPGVIKVPTTRDVYLDKLVPGQTDSDSVWQVQNALIKLGHVSVKRTRDYDTATVAGVTAYQKALGDERPDGKLGPLQTAKLFLDAKIKVNIEARS